MLLLSLYVGFGCVIVNVRDDGFGGGGASRLPIFAAEQLRECARLLRDAAQRSERRDTVKRDFKRRRHNAVASNDGKRYWMADDGC